MKLNLGRFSFFVLSNLKSAIQKIKIEIVPKKNLVKYSKFIMNDLYHYVGADYCLVVQLDDQDSMTVFGFHEKSQKDAIYQSIGGPT